MNPPLVSVVASVHNGADYLRASLESVIKQEGVSFELVVVDDGSTDDSPRILAELASADARLRVLRQENQGLTRSLIRGCAEARGVFIARHDTDDLSLPGRLAKQAERLDREPELAMVSCWARAVGPVGEVLYEIERPAEKAEATNLLLNCRKGPSHHGSVMFRKAAYERVGGYRPQFYFAQDSDLWLRLGEVGGIAYVPQVLYEFSIRESAISSSRRQLQSRIARLVHDCKDARSQGKSEEDILNDAAKMRPGSVGAIAPDATAGAYFIGRCLVSRKDPRARQYLAKVLRQKPWKVGAWAGLFRSCFFSTHVAM
jgi:glycosyltransferase involved in cell wall biosynthesis